MSTQINVIVDDGGLSAKAKQQIQANRWQKLEEAQRAKVAQKTHKQRDAQRLQNGIGLDGRPQYGGASAQSLRLDEPAANRISSEFQLLIAPVPSTITALPASMLPPEGYPYHIYQPDPVFIGIGEEVQGGNYYQASSQLAFQGLNVPTTKGLKDPLYVFWPSEVLSGDKAFALNAVGGPNGGPCFTPSAVQRITDDIYYPASSSSQFHVSRCVLPPQEIVGAVYGKTPLTPFRGASWQWTEEVFVKFAMQPFTAQYDSVFHRLEFRGMFGFFSHQSAARIGDDDLTTPGSDGYKYYETYIYPRIPYGYLSELVSGTDLFWGGLDNGEDTYYGGPLPNVGTGINAASESRWYHLAWVSDGQRMSTYFDGIRVSEYTVPSLPISQLAKPLHGFVNGSTDVGGLQPTYGAALPWGYDIGSNYSSSDVEGRIISPQLGQGIRGWFGWFSNNPSASLSPVNANTGVAQYRFTANRVLYSGSSFTPPTQITTFA